MTGSDRSESLAPHVYLLTTMAFFGSAFASSKAVVAEMPHEVAAALRFGGGAVVLLLVVLCTRGGRLNRRDLVRSGAAGLIGVFAYNVFFFWGLAYAPSLDGVIIVPVLSPVLTTAYLVIAGRERLSRNRAIGLGLGVAEAVVFFLGVGGFGGGRLLGDFIFLLGAVCWAAYTLVSKKVLAGADPVRATACGTTVGALALLVAAAPTLTDVRWDAISGVGWANIGYLMIGPTAIAYLCYYRGLRTVGPSTATVMMFAVPVFGVVCSSVFLHERFTAVQLVGAAVLAAGAVLAVSPALRRDRSMLSA